MNTGDTAWILTSTALVLFMTLPGLALFYGGLVHAKNLLSVLMHCYAIACLASILWLAGGYSLAFDGSGVWIGTMQKFFLTGVTKTAVHGNASTIPETVFFMFQMTFAIITPALIVGAYVERIRFSAVVLISALWLMLVYVPVCHWIWGGGFLAVMGVKDFAGGLVVHLTAGLSALVIAVMLGRRTGFPDDIKPPHAPWMTMVGASMLWVGWFGFNAGSAVAANGDAGMAMAVTHISAATASLVWMFIEWIKYGKPSLVGIVTGTIAGLATITPASGYVGPLGGFLIGLAGGILCYYMVGLIRQTLKIDDSLDVFAVHGFGGLTGILLLVPLMDPTFGGVGFDKGTDMMSQFIAQLTGSAVVAVWSIVVTVVIVFVAKLLVGLRVNKADEVEGLDFTAHGETGYNL